jgi:transcriptional regulator GlxA family with amidase domain
VFVRDGDLWTSAGVTAGMDLALALVEEDLGAEVALAARANLSERSFARAFRREVGRSPAAYVETLRVERARTLLEDGAPSLEAVAPATGFSSAEVLRRAFHRHVGVSPAAYRERFRLAS